MIIFKKDELLSIGNFPARYFAQNEKEYIFYLLKSDWKTELDLITIPANSLKNINITRCLKDKIV